MWKAVRYTTLRESGACNALTDEHGHTATTITEKEEMIVRTAFPPPPEDDGYQAPSGGTMHRLVNQQRVGKAIAGMSNKSAPGEDRMGAEVVKLLWDWDPSRITALARGAIRTGYHPHAWGIVIPKPGKPDYSKARAYRVIALLNSLGKEVEKVAAQTPSTRCQRLGKTMHAKRNSGRTNGRTTTHTHNHTKDRMQPSTADSTAAEKGRALTR